MVLAKHSKAPITRKTLIPGQHSLPVTVHLKLEIRTAKGVGLLRTAYCGMNNTMRTSRKYVRTSGYSDKSTMSIQIGGRRAGGKSRNRAANQAIKSTAVFRNNRKCGRSVSNTRTAGFKLIVILTSMNVVRISWTRLVLHQFNVCSTFNIHQYSPDTESPRAVLVEIWSLARRLTLLLQVSLLRAVEHTVPPNTTCFTPHPYYSLTPLPL